MTHTSGFIMVGQYFQKRKNIANGLATMFVGLGGFAWAPFLNLLLGQYGLSGTFLIYGKHKSDNMYGTSFHLCNFFYFFNKSFRSVMC